VGHRRPAGGPCRRLGQRHSAFGDVEDVTLDFVRLNPDNPASGIVVARVTLPPSCIIKLKSELESFLVYNYEPKPNSYKFKHHKLIVEEQAIVRRRVEEAKRRAYEKLRKRDGR
jgi:hypothetical protein